MKLSDLKGVGEKKILLLHRLGIDSVDDLVSYYPYKYNIIKRTNMDSALDGEKVIVDGIVESQPIVNRSTRNLKRITVRIIGLKNIYHVCVFNQEYLCHELHYGMKVIVIGKYDLKRQLINASEVRIGKLSSVSQVEAVYYGTSGLNSIKISQMIQEVFKSNYLPVDYLPLFIREKYHFMDKIISLKEIHFPTSTSHYNLAKQRLKYEELFLYLLKIQYLKQKRLVAEGAISRNISDQMIQDFINSLSFSLTPDQIIAINDIKEDMRSALQMNRLIQGDVGSGKTIVAFVATYINYLSSYQTALMVPTEILAIQHYQNAMSIFKNTDMKVALLTSTVSKKEREKIYLSLQNGEIDFVIGTQSLIQEGIHFFQLGLVIMDEQHRFGVRQRNILRTKGTTPDILSMSATPIPRSYALALYGDMDVSNIRTKPLGRKETITVFKEEKNITEVLQVMKREIALRHQIYVIAPSILEEDDKLNNATILLKKMRLAFGKIAKVEMVHGKMQSLEKEQIMHNFEVGEIDILISTTVIEVGVNVPNASMIVIFQANFFGLSTLHQLRGRVGRGDIQGYCYLIAKDFNERLEFLTNTSDGFEVSEYDFKTRGEGDLFGVRQSGNAVLKLADVRRDFGLLVKVKKDVLDFFEFHYDEIHRYQRYLDDFKLVN